MCRGVLRTTVGKIWGRVKSEKNWVVPNGWQGLVRRLWRGKKCVGLTIDQQRVFPIVKTYNKIVKKNANPGSLKSAKERNKWACYACEDPSETCVSHRKI